MGHGRRPFLALGEEFLSFQHLCSLKVPELDNVSAAEFDRLQSVVYSRSRHFKELDSERAIERFGDWMERIGSIQVGKLTDAQIRRLQESVERLKRQAGK